MMGGRSVRAGVGHAACRTRLRRRSNFARPYMPRFMTLSRCTCPSTWPVLHRKHKRREHGVPVALDARRRMRGAPCRGPTSSHGGQGVRVARPTHRRELRGQHARRAEFGALLAETGDVGLLGGAERGRRVVRSAEEPRRLDAGQPVDGGRGSSAGR